jgi:hypothetical protein
MVTATNWKTLETEIVVRKFDSSSLFKFFPQYRIVQQGDTGEKLKAKGSSFVSITVMMSLDARKKNLISSKLL